MKMKIFKKEKSESNHLTEVNSCNTQISNEFRKGSSKKSFLHTYSYFYKKPKMKVVKNKTETKFYKANYPQTSKSTRGKIRGYSTFAPPSHIFNVELKDNDALFLDLVRSQDTMKSFNKEIKGIKNDYKYLQQGNFTNLYIIDKLLDLEFDEEGEMEFLNNYIKNKKNYRMLFKENNKINVLKRQIDLYNKTLKKNDKKIEELRNKSKQKRYQELVILIGQKEKEIGEINQKVNELNYNIFENETKQKYYNLKAKQYSDDVTKIEKKLKEVKTNLDDNEEEIKYYKERKEILKKNMKKLGEKAKKKEIEKKDMNEEENNIDQELEQSISILKEKEKNENILQNLKSTHTKIQKFLGVIDKKLSLLKRENDTCINDIEEYEKIRPKLIEKSKIPGRNQEKMRNLEKESEKIKEEIKKRNEEDENKEKNINNQIQEIINANNNYKNEITGFENEKNYLSEEIIRKKDELKNNENRNKELEQELLELEQDFNKQKEEYEQKQKEEEEKKSKENLANQDKEKQIKQNNILKEKNFNEEKDKYEKEIDELTAKNEGLKKENEELKKMYEDKMKNVKEANDAGNKLKNILDEIQKLSV